MTIQHRVHGADRRQLDVLVAAPDLLADLRRTPARMLLLELHDQCLDLKRQAVRMPIWSTRPIGESLNAAIPIASEDLVAGLARDIELATQHRHLLAFQQPSHE